MIKFPRMNEQGMTLITTMVTVAIVAIVSFAITKLITDSMMGQKQIEYSQAVTVIQNSLVGHLSSRPNCTTNFAGINPLAVVENPTIIFQRDGVGRFLETFGVSGATYEGRMVRVQSIRFSDYQVSTLASAGPPPEPEKGAVNLTMGFQSSTQLGGTRDIFRNIKLVVERNSSGEITTCVAVGNDDDDIWRLNPAGDIFYVGNNVGIGTDRPTARLTVMGSVLITGGTLSASEVNVSSIQANIVRSTAFLYRSDKNLKEDIRTSPGLGVVRQLEGRSFAWKDSGKRSLGLIAQEVEKVVPTAVSNSPDGMKAIDYAQLLAPMIESVKALDRENRKIESKIHEIEAKLNHLGTQR